MSMLNGYSLANIKNQKGFRGY